MKLNPKRNKLADVITQVDRLRDTKMRHIYEIKELKAKVAQLEKLTKGLWVTNNKIISINTALTNTLKRREKYWEKLSAELTTIADNLDTPTPEPILPPHSPPPASPAPTFPLPSSFPNTPRPTLRRSTITTHHEIKRHQE